VGESKAAVVFDFSEAIEVELPDKAFKLAVSEEERSDLCLHFFGV